MKTDVSEIAPCRQKIAVEVPPEEVDAAFDESYGTLKQEAQVRGFRKGFVPRQLLERRFRKDVARTVCGKLFQDSFSKCMKDNDLAPMGDPDIDLEKLEAKPGEPFVYTTEVDVRPKFDLPEYRGLKLEDKFKPATDEEVAAKLLELRQRFAEFKPVAEASQEGDTLEVDVVVTVGKKELLDEKTQRVRIEGEQLFGLPCEDLVKELSQLKAGKEKKIKLKLPQDFNDEELRGKSAQVEMKVLQVLRPELPELDQAFAQRLGLEDLEKLRSALRRNIEDERRQIARQEVEEELKTALLSACEFELPVAFMQRQTEVALVRSKLRLERLGATEEFLTEHGDNLRQASADQTERSIRWLVVTDAIAEKEEIEVSEADFQLHLQQLAAANQTTPAKMLKQVEELQGLSAMAAEIRDLKVVKFLLDNADISREKSETGKAAEDKETGKTGEAKE